MSISNNHSKLRLEELDSLRGIAALMVVFFHFSLYYPDAQGIFVFGTTGVDLFFIISGFVIFMSLSKVKSAKEFMVNRFARLFPTYWTAVTLTLILKCIFYFGKGDGIPTGIGWQYLTNLTMFQFYFGEADLDGPYWTMIIEMIFYIFMLTLFVFNAVKFIFYIGFSLTIFLLIFAVSYPEKSGNDILYWVSLLQFFPLFFAGIIFYRIKMEKGNWILDHLVLVLCFITQTMLFEHAGRSSDFISQEYYMVMLGLFFGFFLLFVNGLLSFLVNPVTLFFGKISFSLYLIHQFISVSIIIPVLVLKLNVNFWIASLLVALPVSIAIAYVINKYVEVPFNSIIRKKLLKKEG